MSKSIFVGQNPKIHVDHIGGDVSIVGWDGGDLLIKADNDDLRFEQTGEAVSVSSGSDLSLRVPKGAILAINSIGGDASIRGVFGGIEIKEVHGDLSTRDTGALAIDTIHGDFSLKVAKGNLYVKNLHGDGSIRDVEGNVALDSVSDDLALRGARGNIKANVGEDVVIYLEPRGGYEYNINAGDDILMVLPKNANATLDMHGDEIFMDWQGMENDENTERVVSLGSGAALINLEAGGEIRVSNRTDAGESADEFGNFAGLNFDWSGFGDRISRQVEVVTARATKRAEEAMRRAERHAERHARHAGHPRKGLVVGRWNWDLSGAPKPPSPPAPPAPPAEPVTEDERMAILKMLAEKKISAQQAEELLNALDGGK